jgi:hypothetical protein
MRKFPKRSKPPSPSTDGNQTNPQQNWPAVSQIIKVLVTSGLLLFLCNLGYDAAKATILLRLQLEAENKQLRAQLERIDQKILPKIAQARHEVKEIQKPLQQEKLSRPQLEQLALQARGVCETLEEIEHLLKLTTVAEIEAAEEIELADILLVSPNPAHAAAAPSENRRAGHRDAKLVEANRHRKAAKREVDQDANLVAENFASSDPANNFSRNHSFENKPAAKDQKQEPNNGGAWTLPNSIAVERNLGFLGLPHLPTHRDPAAVRRVIVKHKASIQDCYTRALKENPGLCGEIKVRLTIAANGKVTSVDLVSSTINLANLEQHILERISRWNDFGEVSPAVGNTTFNQTFVLGEGKLAARD